MYLYTSVNVLDTPVEISKHVSFVSSSLQYPKKKIAITEDMTTYRMNQPIEFNSDLTSFQIVKTKKIPNDAPIILFTLILLIANVVRANRLNNENILFFSSFLKNEVKKENAMPKFYCNIKI